MIELLREVNRRYNLKVRFDLARRYISVFGFWGSLYTRFKLYGSSNLGIVTIHVPGFGRQVLRSRTADRSTFHKVFLWGEYDLSYSFEPESILDCGANIGLSSVWFSQRFPRARIFAVEPHPANFELLLQNTRAYTNIVPIQAAVWSREGTVYLKDRCSRVDSYSYAATGGGETVPAYDIATLMSKLGLNRIDVLKLDIEGAEEEVFHSLDLSWLDVTSMIVVELHGRLAEERLSNITKEGWHRYRRGESEVLIRKGVRAE